MAFFTRRPMSRFIRCPINLRSVCIPKILYYPIETYSRQPLKRDQGLFEVRYSKWYRIAARLGISEIYIM